MSFGEWLRAGIAATNPPPPAQQSCHLLRGAGPQRKEGCQSTHPLSEYRPPSRLAAKAAPAWLRPQEVGEEVGLGARRGRGPHRA